MIDDAPSLMIAEVCIALLRASAVGGAVNTVTSAATSLCIAMLLKGCLQQRGSSTGVEYVFPPPAGL